MLCVNLAVVCNIVVLLGMCVCGVGDRFILFKLVICWLKEVIVFIGVNVCCIV